MSQIIQYPKLELLSHFQKISFESLTEPFQTFIQSFPEVFTIETLPPIAETHSFIESDEAILPNQKPNKPIFTKPFHFQQPTPQTPQLTPVFPNKTQSSDNYNSFNYRARSMIRAPFSSSGLSSDLGERVWFYIDEQNEIQGPFTTLEMDSWFDKGFLFDELKICHSMTNKFFSLFDLFVYEKSSKSATNLEFEPGHNQGNAFTV